MRDYWKNFWKTSILYWMLLLSSGSLSLSLSLFWSEDLAVRAILPFILDGIEERKAANETLGFAAFIEHRWVWSHAMKSWRRRLCDWFSTRGKGESVVIAAVVIAKIFSMMEAESFIVDSAQRKGIDGLFEDGGGGGGNVATDLTIFDLVGSAGEQGSGLFRFVWATMIQSSCERSLESEIRLMHVMLVVVIVEVLASSRNRYRKIEVPCLSFQYLLWVHRGPEPVLRSSKLSWCQLGLECKQKSPIRVVGWYRARHSLQVIWVPWFSWMYRQRGLLVSFPFSFLIERARVSCIVADEIDWIWFPRQRRQARYKWAHVCHFLLLLLSLMTLLFLDERVQKQALPERPSWVGDLSTRHRASRCQQITAVFWRRKDTWAKLGIYLFQAHEKKRQLRHDIMDMWAKWRISSHNLYTHTPSMSTFA